MVSTVIKFINAGDTAPPIHAIIRNELANFVVDSSISLIPNAKIVGNIGAIKNEVKNSAATPIEFGRMTVIVIRIKLQKAQVAKRMDGEHPIYMNNAAVKRPIANKIIVPVYR